ncbi:ATP-grasp domain-containing protein [uncultured Sphaerochaeta sp.]|uniref:ATP-grasp domain-containing protein n=1 Tax=uncultured Sphaerochaeta sp. TaxID=886478 RepID=UPI002A0A76FD|nr:ATP-grasp domain-containing protein [uncultured Sphaerochaeta sp.]
MKKIMILGASILQLPAIKKAKQMGLETVVVDMNRDAIGFTIADVCEVISTIDIPKVIEAAKKNQINGIMTLASDMPMKTVAAVAKEMGLVGISEDTALKATNKAEMRKCLKEHNVPIPRYYRVCELDQYYKVISAFQSCIVKPADNSGSRGVYLIQDTSNTISVEEAFHHSKEFSRSGDIVVEEYMKGPEVSVETISLDGEVHIIQITDKMTTGAPFFVEMGHSQPTHLVEEMQNDIKDVAIQAVKAIGIKDGPSHTEIIVTRDGAKIVELGARLGGDCITTHLVPLSTGVDMVECCIKIALGEVPDISLKWNKGAAIRYFESHSGVIEKIAGVEEAKKVPGIFVIDFMKKVGDSIQNIQSSTDRIGFVISESMTAEEAIFNCESAMKQIVFVYKVVS